MSTGLGLGCVLHVDPWAGVAGDMFLAALLDLDPERPELGQVLDKAVEALALPGVRVESNAAMEGGIRCRRVDVEEDNPPFRSPADLRSIIGGAALPETVREASTQAIRRLAQVEAGIHGVPVEDVHLHELGAAATLELLRGCPVLAGEIPGEMTTPTGALLLSQITHVWGSLPSMKVWGVGYGAGSRSLPHGANVLRVVLGEKVAAGVEAGGTRDGCGQIVLLETLVDDATPEAVRYTQERLMEAGAVGAWLRQVIGKKGT